MGLYYVRFTYRVPDTVADRYTLFGKGVVNRPVNATSRHTDIFFLFCPAESTTHHVTTTPFEEHAHSWSVEQLKGHTRRHGIHGVSHGIRIFDIEQQQV